MSALATGRGSLHVTLEGRGAVTLRPSDHVATGGQGAIYRIGDTAVKLYLDPVKEQQRGLPNLIARMATDAATPLCSCSLGPCVRHQTDPCRALLAVYRRSADLSPAEPGIHQRLLQTEGFTARSLRHC